MLKTSTTTKKNYLFKLLLCCCFIINYNIINAQMEQSNQTHCPGDTVTLLPPPLGPLGPLPANCETLTVTPDDGNIITLPNNGGFMAIAGNTSTEYTVTRTGLIANGCYSSAFDISAITNIVIGGNCTNPPEVITQTQTVCNNDTLILEIEDSFEYSVMEQPSNGTLFFTFNAPSSGTDFHYVPNSDFVGTDQFMIHYTNTSTGDEYIISYDVTVNDCGDPIEQNVPNTPYTWLNNLIDANDCCANASVLEFSFGSYSFIYIQTGEDCGASSSLYLNDGSLYCTNGNNLDCLSAYGLNENNGTVLFDCGDGPIDTPGPTDPFDFGEYPWLADIIDENDCCTNESILIFDLGSYSFLYIKSASECGGLGNLYLNTGQLYCTDGNGLNCLAAYGLNESDGTTVWACSNNPTNPTDPTTDYPWLSNIITDDCCANARIYHYAKNNGSYGYIYVEAGDCQDGNYSRLYNEEGLLYCTSASTISCFDHYDLGNSFTETLLWSCDGTEDRPANSSNTEEQSDRLITSENLVKFNVFPNPSSGMINISVDADYEGMESITIYDLSGRVINEFLFEQASIKLFQTDLSDLPDGLYLIKYQNANVSSIEKVMIRH